MRARDLKAEHLMPIAHGALRGSKEVGAEAVSYWTYRSWGMLALAGLLQRFKNENPDVIVQYWHRIIPGGEGKWEDQLVIIACGLQVAISIAEISSAFLAEIKDQCDLLYLAKPRIYEAASKAHELEVLHEIFQELSLDTQLLLELEDLAACTFNRWSWQGNLVIPVVH